MGYAIRIHSRASRHHLQIGAPRRLNAPRESGNLRVWVRQECRAVRGRAIHNRRRVIFPRDMTDQNPDAAMSDPYQRPRLSVSRGGPLRFRMCTGKYRSFSTVAALWLAGGCHHGSTVTVTFDPAIAVCSQGATSRGEWIVDSPPSVIDDEVEFDVELGGGCKDHRLTMCWDGALINDDGTPRADLRLRDSETHDPCDDVNPLSLAFDLSPVRAAADEATPPIGSVVLRLTRPDGSVAWTTEYAP